MKGGWYALIALVYIVGIYFASTYAGYDTPGTWAGTGEGGYSTNPITVMRQVVSQDVADQRNATYGNIQMITPGEFLKAMWHISTFQFNFLLEYPMLWQFLFFPFSIVSIYSLLALSYGVLTGNLSRT